MMIQALKPEKVLIKRGQDSIAWPGKTIASIYYDVLNAEGEVIDRGPYIATEVEDENGFRLWALPNQIGPL